MKKRKLKSYVIPTIYVLTVMTIFLTIILLGSTLTFTEPYDNLDYSIDSLPDVDIPVVEEVEVTPTKPFNGDNINISKDYYSMSDDEKLQQNSLIYYQNTYMQNTGLLYTSTNQFDVISVLDGTVKSVTTDDILGIVVEVSHDNNLTSFYYSLSEVNIDEGTKLKHGDVIGKSGDNKIENKEGSSLLFEIYHQGKAIDPNNFFESKINDYE